MGIVDEALGNINLDTANENIFKKKRSIVDEALSIEQPEEYPVLKQGKDESTFADKIRSFLGIEPKKTTPIDIEAAEQNIRPYDIKEQVFGTGKTEELRRAAAMGLSGASMGLTDVLNQPEAPETPAGQVAGGLLQLAGTVKGIPAQAANKIMQATKIAQPVAGATLRENVGKALLEMPTALGLMTGISKTGEALESTNVLEAAEKIGKGVLSGAATGAIFQGLQFLRTPEKLINVLNLPRDATSIKIADNLLRLGAGIAAIDAQRSIESGQPVGVIAEIQGKDDPRELYQRAFDYALDTYFILKGGDAREKIAYLASISGKPEIETLADVAERYRADKQAYKYRDADKTLSEMIDEALQTKAPSAEESARVFEQKMPLRGEQVNRLYDAIETFQDALNKVKIVKKQVTPEDILNVWNNIANSYPELNDYIKSMPDVDKINLAKSAIKGEIPKDFKFEFKEPEEILLKPENIQQQTEASETYEYLPIIKEFKGQVKKMFNYRVQNYINQGYSFEDAQRLAFDSIQKTQAGKNQTIEAYEKLYEQNKPISQIEYTAPKMSIEEAEPPRLREAPTSPIIQTSMEEMPMMKNTELNIAKDMLKRIETMQPKNEWEEIFKDVETKRLNKAIYDLEVKDKILKHPSPVHLEFIKDRLIASEPTKLAEGYNIAGGYPEWFKNKGYKRNKVLDIINKKMNGISLTSNEQNKLNDLLESSYEEFNKLGKQTIFADELKPNQKIMIDGEIYTNKGVDTKTGEVILQDGKTIKQDIFEPLKVDKVIEEDLTLNAPEIPIKKTKPVQEDMFGFQDSLVNKIPTEEIKTELPLEKATEESKLNKFISEKQSSLPFNKELQNIEQAWRQSSFYINDKQSLMDGVNDILKAYKNEPIKNLNELKGEKLNIVKNELLEQLKDNILNTKQYYDETGDQDTLKNITKLTQLHNKLSKPSKDVTLEFLGFQNLYDRFVDWIINRAYRNDVEVGNAIRQNFKPLVEFFNPGATVPQGDKWQHERQKARGMIATGESIALELNKRYKNLNEDERLQIWEYLNGDRTLNELPLRLKQPAKLMRKLDDRIGKMLVKEGVISQQAYDNFVNETGQRSHIKYIYDLYMQESDLMGGYGAKIDYAAFKQRKDLTPEQREQLGLIKDPLQALSVSLTEGYKAVGMAKYFKGIAGNRQWVLPANATPEGRNQPNQIGNYVLLKGKKYGALDGRYVLKTIAYDIKPIFEIRDDIQDISKNIIKGTFALTSFWKMKNVAFNIPTISRNIMSNFVQLNMSGMNLPEVGYYLAKAIKSYKNEDILYKKFRKQGGFTGNWSATEMQELLSISDLFKTGKLADITKGVMRLGKFYGKIDDVFKLAKFIEQKQHNATDGEAAREAIKWGMDYSLMHPSLKRLRNTPFGIPFLSYQAKIMPLIYESVKKRPWVIAKYIALPYLLQEAIIKDMPEDEVNKFLQILPKYIRNGQVLLLPLKSGMSALDISYILPWGQLWQMGVALKSGRISEATRKLGLGMGVIPSIMYALLRNRDLFTDNPIVNPLSVGNSKEVAKDILKYINTIILPPMFAEYGALGRIYQHEKHGITKTGLPTTAIHAYPRIFGINIYPINPLAKNIEKYHDIKEVQTALKKKMYYDKTLTPEEKEQLLEIYKYHVLQFMEDKE